MFPVYLYLYKNTPAKKKPASFKSRKYRIKKRGSPTKDYVRDATQENEIKRFQILNVIVVHKNSIDIYVYSYLRRKDKLH